MQKIILRNGLIAGSILMAFMLITIPMWKSGAMVDMKHSQLLGYTVMVVALSTVFFGIRTLRDKHNDGKISFGKALVAGLGISLIASAFYVVTWLIVYETAAHDFSEQYMTSILDQLQNSGKPQAEIDRQIAQLKHSMDLYDNNIFYRIGITFLEIFPVGLIVSLVSAGILRRK